VLVAFGIQGRFIDIHRQAKTIIVRMASEATPLDPDGVRGWRRLRDCGAFPVEPADPRDSFRAYSSSRRSQLADKQCLHVGERPIAKGLFQNFLLFGSRRKRRSFLELRGCHVLQFFDRQIGGRP
jgi:hypothetical protein